MRPIRFSVFAIILTIFLFGGRINTTSASQRINIDLDYALFNFNQDTVFWEIYYDIPEYSLTLKKEAQNQFAVNGFVRIKIKKDGVPWYENKWRVRDVHKDSTRIGRSILDKIDLLASKGNYKVTFFIRDLNKNSRTDSSKMNVQILPFYQNRLSLSNIELAAFIRSAPDEKKNPFYKNTLIVEPNPSGLFGPITPSLFFYVEAYNLLKQIHGNKYKIEYYVVDNNDKQIPLIKRTQYEKTKKVNSSVEVGRVNVMALNPGSYYLKVELSDLSGDSVVTARKKFYVFKNYMTRKNRKNASFEKLYLQSKFSRMGLAELDQQFNYSSYIMSKRQKKLYNSLNSLEKKRRMMFDFWYSADPNKATSMNEAYEEYMKRVKYANRYLASVNREGWKTDRGRVYILYGRPTNVDHYPYTANRKPYEIWHYDELQGGVIFVFADLNNLKDYRLLHSTLKGEVYNPDYLKIINEF